VIESDGTLVLNVGKISSGTAYTIKQLKKHKKPCLVIQLQEKNPKTLAETLDWIKANEIKTLNVAGCRESKVPGIYKLSLVFLRVVFGNLTR
jgi:hypothetical protein